MAIKLFKSKKARKGVHVLILTSAACCAPVFPLFQYLNFVELQVLKLPRRVKSMVTVVADEDNDDWANFDSEGQETNVPAARRPSKNASAMRRIQSAPSRVVDADEDYAIRGS